MRVELTNVQQVGNELAVAWADGEETYLALEKLRRSCPCAACGGEPDVLGRVVRPKVEYTPESFILRRIEPIGGYALAFFWGDGHSTGIYSFDYLRRLGSSVGK